jgi:hypothetical protein
VANLLMAMGLSVTIYYSSQDLPPISERKAFAGWTNLPLFFGTAMYAFEGIGLVIFILFLLQCVASACFYFARGLFSHPRHCEM